jgi:hypothetical protein
MSSHNISNEQNQLVNILERMYNDNIRQINGMTNSINHLRNSNTQIRNLLVQILNTNISTSNDTTNTSLLRRASENLRRIYLNNVPYVIDHIEHYTIPSSNSNSNTSNTNNRQERNTRFMQNFLEPVEVYPTQSQIESATRNVQYCDIVNPINRSCPISLETFNDTDMVSVIRFCGHIFKTNELSRWFRTNCRCPVCRYDIRNYNTNQSSLNDNENDSIDVSGNFTNESQTNEQRIPSTINTYLDLIFDTNSLSDSLLNEITNMVDTNDANALLRLFNTSLRRR